MNNKFSHANQMPDNSLCVLCFDEIVGLAVPALFGTILYLMAGLQLTAAA